MNKVSENLYRAKEFYLLSSDIDSVPESLYEQYEETLRELKNFESVRRFQIQELEKLRLQNKDLKSKRKSLLTNRDQSFEPTQRLRELIGRSNTGEIQMR